MPGLEKVPDVAVIAGGLAALSHPRPAVPTPHILARPPSHRVTWAQKSSRQVRDTSCHGWETCSWGFPHSNTATWSFASTELTDQTQGHRGFRKTLVGGPGNPGIFLSVTLVPNK